MLRTCALALPLVLACTRPAVQAPRVDPGERADQPAAPDPREVEQFFAERAELVDAFVAWAKQSAIGDDLAGLDAVIGDARVIALGEADHGVAEYLAYRNRLARYLVEHAGVTAILVESGFTEATAADDYVTGTGTATRRDAAAALFSWRMPAALRANAELVDWLRAYNANAARDVHVYGVDITGVRDGVYAETRRAVDASLAYLAKHAPAAHANLARRLTPLLGRFDTVGYARLDDAQRAALTTAMVDLLAAFGPLPDSPALRRARQHAAMAAITETYLRQTRGRSRDEIAAAGLDSIRDATMAANVIWALAEEGPGSRVLVFAHNGHVRRGRAATWPGTRTPITALGEYLAHSLHDRLVVIGFLHGDGPPTATLDGLFARAGLPSFLLDLRAAPEPVRTALSQRWKLRLDGFRALGFEPVWSAIPLDCFDALVYTATASTAALAR